MIGDLSVGATRFVFYGIGVAALLLIFYIVFGPLREVARHDARVSRIYGIVSGYLALFWIGYPLTWILGPSGLGVVSQTVDTILFVLLPIFSKVGFSIVDLSLLRKMEGSNRVGAPVGSAMG
jgi:bacteriorhodopsin